MLFRMASAVDGQLANRQFAMHSNAKPEYRDIYTFLDICAYLNVPPQLLLSPSDLLFYRHNSASEKLSRTQDIQVNGRVSLLRRKRLFNAVLAFVEQFNATRRKNDYVMYPHAARQDDVLVGSSKVHEAMQNPEESNPVIGYRSMELLRRLNPRNWSREGYASVIQSVRKSMVFRVEPWNREKVAAFVQSWSLAFIAFSALSSVNAALRGLSWVSKPEDVVVVVAGKRS